MVVSNILDKYIDLEEKDDFIGNIFGEEGQLTVVGWDGVKSHSNKIYKVHCTKCAKDEELFVDGCFYSIKGSLVRGGLPCGCSKKPNWTEEQYKIRINRKCKEYGDLEFLGFSDEFKGNRTKLKLQCSKHEEPYVYEKTTIANLFSGQRGCHLCKIDTTKLTNIKPDQGMIDSFFASGVFKEGTKFYRSERKDSKGVLSYWNYTCPLCYNDEYAKEGLCSGVFESGGDCLQKGILACRCGNYYWNKEQREYQINKRIREESIPYVFLGWINDYKNKNSKFKYKCKEHGEQKVSVDKFLNSQQGCPQCAGNNQQECYINGVYDKETLIALKFGIANNSKQRIKAQNKKSIFGVRQLKVFSFPSVVACKAAEAACKQELVCGILSKQEMPDGFSETTSPLNMDKVIDIYKRFGGMENKSK